MKRRFRRRFDSLLLLALVIAAGIQVELLFICSLTYGSSLRVKEMIKKDAFFTFPGTLHSSTIRLQSFTRSTK